MLDVRTIVVLLIVSSLLMAAALAVGVRAGRGHGYAKWNYGLALIAAGWLLVAARGEWPDLVTMALADATLLAGLCLQLAAVLEFGERSAPAWLIPLPAAALFLASLPLLDDYSGFTLLTSVSGGCVLLAIAYVAARQGGGTARWILAASYAIGALGLIGRALAIHFAPDAAYYDVFTQTLVQSAAFLLLFAITITTSFAFLLMHRDRAEAEIRRLAMIDPLTTLFNRRAFIDLAERELARAARLRAPFSVLMMDLDHFKRVNDAHGHQAGDRVLAEFAALAQRSVRAGDLVGRYGGEEFCALLPGASLDTALAIAERLRAAAAARPLGGLPNAITVSIGVASCDPAAAPCDLDGVIALADAALYRAKREGRNRVAVDAAARPALRVVGRGQAPAG